MNHDNANQGMTCQQLDFEQFVTPVAQTNIRSGLNEHIHVQPTASKFVSLHCSEHILIIYLIYV